MYLFNTGWIEVAISVNESSHNFFEFPISCPVRRSVPKGPTFSINVINFSVTVFLSPIMTKSFAFFIASGKSFFKLISLLKVPDARFETVFKSRKY